jgi:hypothetical protein
MFKLWDNLYITRCAILYWSRIYYYHIIWTFSYWEIHVFKKNYITYTAARIFCPPNAIQCNIKRTSTGHPQGWPTATKSIRKGLRSPPCRLPWRRSCSISMGLLASRTLRLRCAMQRYPYPRLTWNWQMFHSYWTITLSLRRQCCLRLRRRGWKTMSFSNPLPMWCVTPQSRICAASISTSLILSMVWGLRPSSDVLFNLDGGFPCSRRLGRILAPHCAWNAGGGVTPPRHVVLPRSSVLLFGSPPQWASPHAVGLLQGKRKSDSPRSGYAGGGAFPPPPPIHKIFGT